MIVVVEIVKSNFAVGRIVLGLVRDREVRADSSISRSSCATRTDWPPSPPS